MRLHIVDKISKKPMSNVNVDVVLLSAPGEFSSAETISDNQGECLIKIRQKSFSKLGITVFVDEYSPGSVNFTPDTFTNQHVLKLAPQSTNILITANVVLPDGSPASNVRGVILSQGMNFGLSITQSNHMTLDSIDPFIAYGLRMFRLSNAETGSGRPFDIWTRIRTDENGSFSVHNAPYREGLAILHEKGYAHLRLEEIPDNQPIRLTPWGQIEGVLNRDQEVGERQKVMVCNMGNPSKDSFVYRYATETDEQGRFSFSYVPAGPCMVTKYFEKSIPTTVNPLASTVSPNSTNIIMRRYGSIPSQPPMPPPSYPKTIFVQNDFLGNTAIPLEVKPGKVTHTTLGGKGRTVTGKFLSSSYSGKIDWKKDLLVNFLLSEKTMSGSSYQGAVWPPNAPNLARWKDIIVPGHFIDIQPDGSFSINDVPPGIYRLNVQISKTSTNANNSIEVRKVAFSNQKIQVTDSDDKSNKWIDIGNVELELLPNAGELIE